MSQTGRGADPGSPSSPLTTTHEMSDTQTGETQAPARHSFSRGPVIGLVAGESSGDQLGAALIAALRAIVPEVRCFGVAGPKMVAAGCEAWASAEELAVMGFTEPLLRLPRLLKLRAMLADRLTNLRPDVFVGIDAPAFNLGLAKRLKGQGLRTVQYVSPQVWAWRQGRVRTIGRSVDLVLCLLPFEMEFYSRHGVRAEFVGHPLADQIPLDPDRAAARRELNIDSAATVIALLPGSRLGEVQRLGGDFAAAAAWIASRRPGTRFVAPMASPRVRKVFERHVAQLVDAPSMRLLDGQAQRALAAADGAIVASGTATLETLLSGRPMVVAYRLSPATTFLLRTLGLVKVPYFSQPNLLVGRRLVPEFFQEQVSGEALGAALLHELQDARHVSELTLEFRRVHEALRRGGAARAAAAIIELTGRSLPNFAESNTLRSLRSGTPPGGSSQ
jgi:lipid-A-disaccharide synthase